MIAGQKPTCTAGRVTVESRGYKPSLSDHDRDVHPGVAVPVEPGHCPEGKPDRRSRDARRDRRHLPAKGRQQLLGDHRRHGRRRHVRRRRRAQGAHDGHATDGRVVQRSRRRRGCADLAGRVPPARTRSGNAQGRHQLVDRALRDHREHLVLGIDDRVREAAGADPRTPDHLPVAAGRERPPLRRPAGGRDRDHRGQRAAMADVGVGRPALRSSESSSSCRSAAPTCRS